MKAKRPTRRSVSPPSEVGEDVGRRSAISGELRRLRALKDLSQQAVADAVEVRRSTVTQWEASRYPPSAARIRRLDAYFGAGGSLIELAGLDDRDSGKDNDRDGEDDAWRPAAPLEPMGTVAEVFEGVADRLVEGLVRDPRDPANIGWSQSLGGQLPPTPWSTALGLRTLLLLDRVEIDLHEVAQAVGRRQCSGGWSNRDPDVPRPDVTAAVLAMLHRLGGGGADLPAAWSWLAGSVTADERHRPFVLSTMLENLAPIRPDDRLVAELVRLLLDARTDFEGVRLWASNASAEPHRVEPSVAHTARAVVALTIAAARADHPEVADAVAEAFAWLAGDRTDDGITETFRIVRDRRGLDVPVDHFTAAHVVRAFVTSREVVPQRRLEAALDTLWSSYVPAESVWVWKHDGRLPVWMNHDAVMALRAAAFVGQPTPARPERGGFAARPPESGAAQ